jgi:lipid-binding SYLF domain-containing protein
MNMIRHFAIAATATLFFCMSISTAMAKATPKDISNAVRVLNDITVIKKDRIPPALLKNAQGIAIFPGAIKNDFMVSGKSVHGVLLTHDNEGKWSNPVFITLSGGTLGWQMVGEPMDIILVFKNKERVDAIIKEKLYLDSKVNVVPGPLVKTMKPAPTKEELKAEINSYVRSHGEFAEVSVASTTVQIDNATNDAFYGKPKISAGDIVSGKEQIASEKVKDLKKLLTEYAAGK